MRISKRNNTFGSVNPFLIKKWRNIATGDARHTYNIRENKRERADRNIRSALLRIGIRLLEVRIGFLRKSPEAYGTASGELAAGDGKVTVNGVVYQILFISFKFQLIRRGSSKSRWRESLLFISSRCINNITLINYFPTTSFIGAYPSYSICFLEIIYVFCNCTSCYAEFFRNALIR